MEKLTASDGTMGALGEVFTARCRAAALQKSSTLAEYCSGISAALQGDILAEKLLLQEETVVFLLQRDLKRKKTNAICLMKCQHCCAPSDSNWACSMAFVFNGFQFYTWAPFAA